MADMTTFEWRPFSPSRITLNLAILLYFVDVFLDLRDHEVASIVLPQVIIETINKPFKIFLEGLILKLLDVVIVQVDT